MRRFTVSTDGPNRLRLRELGKRYVDECWVADHLTPEQAAASVRDGVAQMWQWASDTWHRFPARRKFSPNNY